MKHFLLALLCLFIYGNSIAQHSCCNVTASTDKDMAADPAFIHAHKAPLPFNFVAKNAMMVNFPAPDGKKAYAYEALGTNRKNIILMFHEWWGLNDYIKQEAEKWSQQTGATVIAVDLYDGKVAAKPDEASKLMQGLNEDRVRAIISGAIDFAGKESKIQTLGWCMGGKWSLQAALMAGNHAKGCVMYYGMPETDVKKLMTLNCPVIGFFGTKDDFITPKIVNEFKQNMHTAKKQLTVHNYDAVHAFANPSNPDHDEKATADARDKALTFLKYNFSK
jgi:carboxymethylenebutenolidase